MHAWPRRCQPDEEITLSDMVYVINYILKSLTPPDPADAADVNCDGNGDLPDVVYLINYLFQGGAAPGDPDDDGLPDC